MYDLKGIFVYCCFCARKPFVV